MQPPAIPRPSDCQLFHHAYLLADELAALPVFQEIFIQNKDMEYHEWSIALQDIFTQLDQSLLQECGIAVFRAGLHGSLDMPVTQPINSAFPLPEPVLVATRRFGREFRQMVSAMQAQFAAGEADLPGKDQDGSFASILELCGLMVNSILDELGLQNRDLARIY